MPFCKQGPDKHTVPNGCPTHNATGDGDPVVEVVIGTHVPCVQEPASFPMLHMDPSGNEGPVKQTPPEQTPF